MGGYEEYSTSLDIYKDDHYYVIDVTYTIQKDRGKKFLDFYTRIYKERRIIYKEDFIRFKKLTVAEAAESLADQERLLEEIAEGP